MEKQRRLSEAEVRAVVHRGDWFKELPDQLKARLLEEVSVRRVDSGTLLVEEGRVVDGMHCLLAGQLKFTMRIGEDRDYILHMAGPGFWYGEVAVLMGSTSVATVTAMLDSQVLFVPAARFRSIVAAHPDFYKPLAQLFARRYLIALRQLAEATQLSREPYLRTRLADLALMLREDGAPPSDIELMLSQADLASMVGVSRQTMNVYLSRLEAEGLIQRSFRSLKIPDPNLLAPDREPAARKRR